MHIGPRTWVPLVALLLAGLTTWLVHGRLTAEWENAVFDFKIRHTPRSGPDPRILLVGIDEETLKRKLFNRHAHAQLVRSLARQGVKVVFFDLLFDEDRDPDMDADLAQALSDTGIGVVAGAITGEDALVPPRLIAPITQVVQSGRASLGLINVPPDAVVRRLLLGVRVLGDDDTWGDQPLPCAALASLARLNHLRSADLSFQPARVVAFPQVIAASVRSETQQTLEFRYYKTLSTYHAIATGPDASPGPRFPVIPYWQLLDPELAAQHRDQLKGAIVFVGENTRADTDLVRTPVGRMKGVEVHAQLFNTLLAGPHLQDPLPSLEWLYYLSAGLLIWLLTYLVTVQPTLDRCLLTSTVGLGLVVAANLGALRFGLMLDLVPLVVWALGALGLVLTFRVLLATGYLSRFVPTEVVAELLRSGQAVEASEVTATIIVTDIRGYTTLSESKTPVQILNMLNEYHNETVAIYLKWGGYVLNYQGDAQIVIFGYPKKLRDPAGAAVQAALETSRSVVALRQRWGITDKANFDVGAGVCTGVVAVGELGSGQQTEYTVIGETVRKCHKVQSMSTALDSNVLLDEPTFKILKAQLKVERVENVELEGISYPVTLYRTFE